MQQTMDLLEGVHMPEDVGQMTDLEKMHIPFISCPDTVKAGEPFDCTVHVGEYMTHPNDTSHFIQFIDLYLDENYIARSDFQTTKSNPKVTFNLTLKHGGRLRAYQNCNLHGVWKWEKIIEVL